MFRYYTKYFLLRDIFIYKSADFINYGKYILSKLKFNFIEDIINFII
jgi:hypothetical protein